MSRRRDALYAGAVGRATLAQAAAAGRSYVLAPKYDGIYCTATTDARGRVAHLFTRTGLPVPSEIARELVGVVWAPNSVLVGELECWTEAANRMAARRGYRCLHLFDAIRVAGADVSSLPYSGRRDALLRAESALACEDLDKPWLVDAQGDAHDPASGHYTRRVPRSWRRMPVVPQLPASHAEQAWADWVERDGGAGGPAEGLVVVAVDARIGARSSKRKVKRATSIDCVVAHAGKRVASLSWAGGTFTCPAGGLELRVGQKVECTHESFYERSGQPRFPRISRMRPDLVR
jgi:hypothetical protein